MCKNAVLPTKAIKNGRSTIVLQKGEWLQRLPYLASGWEHFTYLHSHNNKDAYGKYDWICAFGRQPGKPLLYSLKQMEQWPEDWYFGHLNYNLKNEIEALHTAAPDTHSWRPLEFFCPHTVIYAQGEKVTMESSYFANQQALESTFPAAEANDFKPLKRELLPQWDKEQYLAKIARLKEHLQYGNIYEVNFCTEFTGREQIIPAAVFQHLNAQHQAPFSAFYRSGADYLLCFSPERYLQKAGKKLYSQPIKGTAPRYTEPEKDAQSMADLRHSEKEQAENVMIVDLMRNDLSKVATKASVQVEELFGVYSYPAVHQLVSTVSCTLKPHASPADILRATFPMGSMTGAPKVSALQIIENEEELNRSLYSGSVGYFDPEGNFDFNVVIRSILYQAQQHLLSLRVGSAITVHCQAEQEYEECLLKAEKILQTIHGY